MLYIEFDSPEHADLTLELFDATGRKVMVREYRHVSGMIETVDVSDMPGGIYYLRLRQDAGQALRKIILR